MGGGKVKLDSWGQHKYWCPKCKVFFMGMNKDSYRLATGTFISHRCGEVACFTEKDDYYHNKYPKAKVEGLK